MGSGIRAFIFIVSSVVLGLLAQAPAEAKDYEAGEGELRNTGNTPLICLKDVYLPEHVICHARLPVGSSCHGDAVTHAIGQPVYKVPNSARFSCWETAVGGVTCDPADIPSSVVLRLARIKNGSDRYGSIAWPRFMRLMRGNNNEVPLRECDLAWRPLPALQYCPVGGGLEFRETFRDLNVSIDVLTH